MIHDQDSVHILRYIIHAVAYQDHSHPGPVAECRDPLEQLVPSLRIQSGSRFIKDQDLRTHRKNTCQRDSAFLSAGQVER